MAFKRVLFFMVVSASCASMMSQTLTPQKIIEAGERQLYEFPQEKAYVMTDKANYLGGDTIWFRGFVLDAASHQPVKVSRYLYVELCDPFGDVAQRVMVREKDGIYSGYLPLDLDIADGEYQLSAYTNFMQNQPAVYFPKKKLGINNLFAVKERIDYDWNAAKRELELRPVDSSTGKPLPYESILLTTTGGKQYSQSGNKATFKVKLNQQDAESGLVKVSCDNYSTFITLPTAGNDDYDITFHPEGGYLIPDENCVVAFKAIGKDGKGVDVAGKIVDSSGKEIAAFKTQHAGMGKVNITPRNGENYMAVLADGKRFALPAPDERATVLQVRRTAPDSITINVAGNNLENGTIVLQQRGIVLWASDADSNSSFRFATTDALSGVMQILLLDSNLNPVSERLVFCDNDDYADATITPDSKTYGNRKHVDVSTGIATSHSGNFAVSVIDNGTAVVDSINPVKAQLLLSSDLKGYIENPGYYFSTSSPSVAEALDNLMLTQGWSRYDIPAILKGDISYPAQPIEKSMSITGSVSSKWRNKPLKDISLALISPATGYGNITTTDSEGRFKFDGFEYPDGTTYFVQAVNNSGAFEDNIVIDSLAYPAVGLLPSSYRTDRFNIPPSALKQRAEMNPELKSILLSEVVISELMMKSENRWLAGIISSQVNTSDPALRGVTSVEDAIMRLNGISVSGSGNITFRGRPVGVFIDNVPLDATVNLGMGAPETLDAGTRAIQGRSRMFRQSTLRDPKGYLYTSPSTNLPEVNIINEINNVCSYDDIASISFVRGGAASVIGNRAPGGTIVIKTKDGKTFSKIREHNPHIAIAKPLGYQKAAEFYSPKYEVTDRPDGTDLRSTVYWNPCVRFGDDGKADFEFFTSDNPATSYTIFIEGITDDGRIITGSSQIEIK
ncbi:MAG: hypothetical protein J6B03_01835 [Candidatus Homeothermus sp.]|nr:hypothetical protein [Candidatus Homeothermus sp.]